VISLFCFLFYECVSFCFIFIFLIFFNIF